jgi:hypothetical protein
MTSRVCSKLQVPHWRGHTGLGLVATFDKEFLDAARGEHKEQLRRVQASICETVPIAPGHEYEVPGACRERAVAVEEL